MTTRLDIINHMLNVIGESPVTDPDSTDPSVQSANIELRRVNKELQERGWWFNIEYDLPLSPNEAGHILIPTDTLFIDPVDSSSRLVRRGNKLYDPVNHTFVIDEQVRVNMLLLLSIEDLPPVASTYVLHKSAYDFYVNDDGDETKSNRLEQREMKAWADLQREELKATNVNSRLRPVVAHLRSRMHQQGVHYNPKYPGGRT